MEPNYFMNGSAHGQTAGGLLAANGDPRVFRPFIAEDGNTYRMTTNHKGEEVPMRIATHNNNGLVNNAETLLYREWVMLDEVVLRVQRARLRVVQDIMGVPGCAYNLPNGMAHTVIQHQTQSDTSGAIKSMDPRRRSDVDRPVYDLTGIPLPLTFKDVSIGIRDLLVSRNGSMPLDTASIEQATRHVAESIEQDVLGVATQYSYAGATAYGIANFPSRLTKVLTAPTAAGWTPTILVNEILAMKQQLFLAFRRGPYMLYTAPAWDPYLDDDYSAAKGSNTVRERILQISGITDVRTADYLTGNTILMVQITPDVIQIINGMQIQVIRWDADPFEQKMKIIGMMVPRIRKDYNNSTGICHGS
jgi:uncharacterized linocin/CFP29 family protein